MLSLEAATRDSTSRSITAMSTVATYRDFQLVRGRLEVIEKDWVRTQGRKKYKEKIQRAVVVLLLQDRTGKQRDITIEDHVTRCGSGASKDVFMLDKYNFVLKMNADVNAKSTWGEEQGRFDKYKHLVENEMMYCFGQIVVKETSMTPQRFEGDASVTLGDASILLAEKLIFTGKTKLTSFFTTMQCTPEAWEAYVQMQVEILRLLFRFLHQGVIPWDAKIDNVGLAQGRESHSAPVLVFCDLDGLRDGTEYVNAGGAFKKIVQNMIKQDYHLMEPHQMDASAHGWQAPYDQVQRLIGEALVTDEMGQRCWTCLGSIWSRTLCSYNSFSALDSYFSRDVFSHRDI